VPLNHRGWSAGASKTRWSSRQSRRPFLSIDPGLHTALHLLFARADSASVVEVARRFGMSSGQGVSVNGLKSRSGSGRSLIPDARPSVMRPRSGSLQNVDLLHEGARPAFGVRRGRSCVHGLRRCGDIGQRAQGAGTPPDAQFKRDAARDQAAVERSPGCQGCGGYGGGAEEACSLLVRDDEHVVQDAPADGGGRRRGPGRYR
jgi:hypothetical protein